MCVSNRMEMGQSKASTDMSKTNQPITYFPTPPILMGRHPNIMPYIGLNVYPDISGKSHLVVNLGGNCFVATSHLLPLQWPDPQSHL